jgi:cytoskeletal protein RodZ
VDAFGQRLKSEREARGVSLADIAAATKISPAALEALERNEVQRLPGGIFGRAIVRSYAISVGLDPEATVNEFLSEIARVERERARTTRRPEISSDDRQFLERQRRAVRLLRAVLTALVIVAAAAAAWYLWGRNLDRSAATSKPPTAPSAAVVPPPPAAAAPPPPVQHDAEVVAPILVEFEVSAECWVRIIADGSSSASVNGLVQPGSRRRVPAAKSIYLSVGNAGVFQWWINGKPAKPLGPPGATRQVTVTEQNIASFLQ